MRCISGTAQRGGWPNVIGTTSSHVQINPTSARLWFSRWQPMHRHMRADRGVIGWITSYQRLSGINLAFTPATVLQLVTGWGGAAVPPPEGPISPSCFQRMRAKTTWQAGQETGPAACARRVDMLTQSPAICTAERSVIGLASVAPIDASDWVCRV